jgi:hypothetical protein
LGGDPHRNIGLLLSRDENSFLMKATGFLIGNDLVLTSAHFLIKLSKKYPIKFYPGQIKLIDAY